MPNAFVAAVNLKFKGWLRNPPNKVIKRNFATVLFCREIYLIARNLHTRSCFYSWSCTKREEIITRLKYCSDILRRGSMPDFQRKTLFSLKELMKQLIKLLGANGRSWPLWFRQIFLNLSTALGGRGRNEIYGRRVINAILFSADRFNASTPDEFVFTIVKHHFLKPWNMSNELSTKSAGFIVKCIIFRFS